MIFTGNSAPILSFGFPPFTKNPAWIEKSFVKLKLKLLPKAIFSDFEILAKFIGCCISILMVAGFITGTLIGIVAQEVFLRVGHLIRVR